MKDVSIAFLGIFFVILSLMALIAADSTTGPSWMRGGAQEHVSEIELQYALRR